MAYHTSIKCNISDNDHRLLEIHYTMDIILLKCNKSNNDHRLLEIHYAYMGYHTSKV